MYVRLRTCNKTMINTGGRTDQKNFKKNQKPPQIRPTYIYKANGNIKHQK